MCERNHKKVTECVLLCLCDTCTTSAIVHWICNWEVDSVEYFCVLCCDRMDRGGKISRLGHFYLLNVTHNLPLAFSLARPFVLFLFLSLLLLMNILLLNPLWTQFHFTSVLGSCVTSVQFHFGEFALSLSFSHWVTLIDGKKGPRQGRRQKWMNASHTHVRGEREFLVDCLLLCCLYQPPIASFKTGRMWINPPHFNSQSNEERERENCAQWMFAFVKNESHWYWWWSVIQKAALAQSAAAFPLSTNTGIIFLSLSLSSVLSRHRHRQNWPPGPHLCVTFFLPLFSLLPLVFWFTAAPGWPVSRLLTASYPSRPTKRIIALDSSREYLTESEREKERERGRGRERVKVGRKLANQRTHLTLG